MRHSLLFLLLGWAALGAACGGPSPKAEQGEIVCEEGLALCEDSCVDLQSDRAHCGSCGAACAANSLCSDSLCSPCPEGELACGGACVDIQREDRHCGACGQRCQEWEECFAGSCTERCLPEELRCEGVCIDPIQEDAHCGGCGKACDEDFYCAGGQCVSYCQQGETRCGEICVRLQSDSDHCGACGVACGADQSCSASSCVPRCDAGELFCDGLCVDTQLDPQHCGGCGQPCVAGENLTASCSEGQCVYACSEDYGSCGEEPCGTYLVHNDQHCGACGVDCSALPQVEQAHCLGSSCTFSQADCVADYGDCDGDPGNGCEVHLLEESAHCGACNHDCEVVLKNSAASRCEQGSCALIECNANWGVCDGDPAAGCLVNHLEDRFNCGECGPTSCAHCDQGNCKAIAEVALSTRTSCVRWEDGEVVCWGEGWGPSPFPVRGVADAKSLAGGEFYQCVVQGQGEVACWGSAEFLVGTNKDRGRAEEVQGLPEGYQAKQVSLSVRSGCVLMEDGEVGCWSTATSFRPYRTVALQLEAGDRVREVQAGRSLTNPDATEDCALSEQGRVYCWDSSGESISPPTELDFGGRVMRLALGSSHGCALREDGKLFCWGSNGAYQLGDGTNVASSTPVEATEIAALSLRDVFVGSQRSCVIDTAGDLYCWGQGGTGRLGLGVGTGIVQAPSKLPIAEAKRGLLGSYHACVPVESGALYCFGHNSEKESGSGGAYVYTPNLIRWTEPEP